MNFGSDNMVGASAQVMQTISEANHGTTAAYGNDEWCQRATQLIRECFEHDEARVFYVGSGTVANSLALSALVPPWGSIYAQTDAHILSDESTAPELFTGGARLLPIAPVDGKVPPAALRAALERPGNPPHGPVPGALSLTQCNERGRVYTPEMLSELTAVAREHNLRVHVDGARFANAVASLDVSPADLTWRAGIDVLALGASKNGALMAEAVVFFDPELAHDFTWRVKRAGQMVSKGRFFGAQFVGWLQNDHWLTLARHANTMAQHLASAVASLPGVRLAWSTEANEVFAIFPKRLAEALWNEGAVFYPWALQAAPDDPVLGPNEIITRLVTSYTTHEDEIETFKHTANRLSSS